MALGAAAPRPRQGQAVPWQDLFTAASGPRWVDRAAQIQAESGFNPDAVSPVGAEGPAQFMPGTWRHAITQGWAPASSSPRDPAAAIPAQHHYMTWLEAFLDGFEPALGGYNAGPGNIRKAALLARSLGLPGGRAWLDALPRVTGTAHAAETRSYLAHNARFRAAIQARLSARP